MRWRQLAWTLAPPVAACALARAVVVGVSTGPSFFDIDHAGWARWDSENYISIAQKGYYWTSCSALGTPQFGSVCSNTTWYPGYVYAAKAATWFGLPLAESAIALSVVCWVTTIVAIWVWFLRDGAPVHALSCLTIAAFFPGVVYQQALFPISLLALLTVLTIHLAMVRRWWWAAAAAGLAGFVYPIGVVLVPAMVVWVLLVRTDVAMRARVLLAAATAAIASAGTIAVFVIQQIQVGRWNASLTMQQKIGTRLLNPVSSLIDVVVRRESQIQLDHAHLEVPIAAQTLLVAVLVLGITLFVAVGWARARAVDRDELALLLLAWGIWLLPLASFIDTGLYRREATLLPVVALAPRLPVWASVPLAVACVWVATRMSPHFFDSTLI